MIIRKIKPDELKRTYEVFTLAFEFPVDEKKSFQQIADEAMQSPKKEKIIMHLNVWRHLRTTIEQ